MFTLNEKEACLKTLHSINTFLVSGTMTDFRISLGFIVVVLYPVKKSLSILIAHSPSTNIRNNNNNIITVIMTGILPIDAKFSVAPLANSTGFKSDIGLAVMMFPAKDYDAYNHSL